jgi:putative transferase (TIGR04331 family)
MVDKKIKNFITTYNFKTWEENKNNIYSGTWSVPYRKQNLNIKKNILTYHWSDKSKLIKDYSYLKKIYEESLKSLAITLNKQHNINLSLKSWRLLLSPWLISIISIIFDKYENLKLATKKHKKYHTKILNYSNKDFISNNYLDFILNKTSNDNWHQAIFSDLILEVFSKNFHIKKIDKSEKKNEEIYKFKLNIKDLIKKFACPRFFLKKNDYFLDSSYINFSDFIKIMFKIKQLPFWISSFFETKELQKNNSNINLRKELTKKYNFKSKNNFEKYLKNKIIFFLPMSYLENFLEYQNNAKYFNFNGKKIISRGAQFSNDLYKHWCVIQAEKGVKHYISFHGGGVPLKDINFGYEYKTFDKIIVHHKPFEKKQIKLPVLNFNKNYKYNISSKKILLVTKPSISKFISRLDFCPDGPENLDDFLKMIELAEKIKRNNSENIRFRFLNDNWNNKERIGSFKIDEQTSYDESLKNTKIVISSYLLTPFSESVTNGIPSICLLNKEKWIFNKKFKPLIEEMKKNKILFFSAIECAKHINKHYDTINEWWYSQKVKSTIIKFQNRVYYLNKNKKIEEWSNFIKPKN